MRVTHRKQREPFDWGWVWTVLLYLGGGMFLFFVIGLLMGWF